MSKTKTPKTKTPKTTEPRRPVTLEPFRPPTDNSEQIIANLVASKMNGEHPEISKWLIEVVKKNPSVHTVEVSFSGSGDSGDIQGTDYYGPNREWLEGSEHVDHPTELYDLIESHVTCDWVNNEGGGGRLEFYLTDMTIHVTSYYYSETECDDKVVSLVD
jgi:hypothetical protein